MENLPTLFKIIELMRAQSQYGYLVSGIPKNQLSGLGDHHYLVTFMGWQLATNLKLAGAKIDVLKVVEFCLIHDIGELMGGDISAPYGSINKHARKFAKAFEEENQKFISQFFGKESRRIRDITKEILDAKTDEALIAKIADYVECTNFKVYIGYYGKFDKDFNKKKINEFISKIKDKTARQLLKKFLSGWLKTLEDNDYIKMLESNGF